MCNLSTNDIEKEGSALMPFASIHSFETDKVQKFVLIDNPII